MDPQLLKSAAAVQTADDFRDWSKDYIRPLFPHQALISGWGHFHAGGVGLDYLLTVDFPAEHIEAIRNRAGAIDTPILGRWLETEEPVIFDVANPWPDAPEKWLASFRAHGLRNLLAHALIDDDRSAGTYHCFFQLARAPTEEDIATVRELVPIMHRALCRVVDSLGAASQFAQRLALLTERKRDIARWVGLGKTNLEIGQITGTTESGIKHCLSEIFDELGLANRSQLVRRMTEYETEMTQAHKTRFL